MQAVRLRQTRIVQRIGCLLVAGALVCAMAQGGLALEQPCAEAQRTTSKKGAPTETADAGQREKLSGKPQPSAQQVAKVSETDGNSSDDADASEPKSEPDLLDLKEMLNRAQRNHPSIRAAEARVALARAELDQVRLQVANEVIEARRQWRSANAAVAAARAELQEAERAQKSNPTDQYRQMIEWANERLKAARDELAAVESRLALLLGKEEESVKAEKAADASEREQLAGKLQAIGQQMVKAAVADYREGKVDISSVLAPQKRLGRLEISLAQSEADKRAAIDAHIKYLNDVLRIAEQRYRAGQVGHNEVLAVRYALTEAELWKLESS